MGNGDKAAQGRAVHLGVQWVPHAPASGIKLFPPPGGPGVALLRAEGRYRHGYHPGYSYVSERVSRFVKVQFRVDDPSVDFLRARGFNANEVARRAFEAEVRRMRARDAQERLRRVGVSFTGDAAALVREEREAH